jgi:exopolysaccharide biosynthesis polyprenyl glycosylphosphotransferase
VTIGETFAELRSLINSSDQFVAAPYMRRTRYSQRIVCHILATCEAGCVGGAAFLLIRFGHVPGISLFYAVNVGIAAAAIVAFFAFLSGAASFDRYASRLSILPGAIIGAVYLALAIMLEGASWTYAAVCASALLASVYMIKFPFSRFKNWLTDHGYLIRLVAIATDNPANRGALLKLLRRRDDIKIVFAGSPSAVDVLSSLTQDNNLDEIVLAGHEATEENIAALAGLAVTLVRVTPQDRLEHHAFDRRWGKKRVFSPWNAPAAVITQPPMAGWQGVIKRLMDIVGATIALILLAPVMIACAIAIKFDSSGPLFFVQERAGYRNKTFRMLKFRSMQAAAADPTGSLLTIRNDPRVTSTGAFLRRTSADELPQLLNVLMGDMSLVGPRPHPKGAKAGTVLYDELIPNFYSRYRMKPGITGLAQVNGLRGTTETEQHLFDRFGTDLQYASEWTPFLDIAILLRTVTHVFKGTNAF